MNTDTIKRYRLLKDIETIDLSAKAGDIGIFNFFNMFYADKDKVWFDNNRYFFYISQIEKNLGVWFEEVLPVSEPAKDKLEIYFSKHSDEGFYRLYYTGLHFDMIKARKAIKKVLNDTVVGDTSDGLFTKEQQEYVNSIADADLRSHLLHQVRLMDTMSADRDSFEKQLNEERIKHMAEVDAIEEKAFNAAKCGIVIKRTNLTGGFSCNDITPITTYQDYKNNPNYKDYLSSLNLNTNDTPKVGDVIGSATVTKVEKVNLEERDRLFHEMYSEQPTNDNAFVWTDELVKEFVITYNKIANLITGVDPIGQSIIEFKQMKPAPPPSELKEGKDWEIVSFKHGSSETYFNLNCNGNYQTEKFSKEEFAIDDLLHNKIGKTYLIHSVKRLSDNTVWEVKERFSNNAAGIYTEEEIKSFEIEGTLMKVRVAEGDDISYYELRNIDKLTAPIQPVVEDKPILITTEEGVKKYKDDNCWCWDSKSDDRPFQWYSLPEPLHQISADISGYKYFDSEQAAKLYMLENKPCLSINEIISIVGDSMTWYGKQSLLKAVKIKSTTYKS